MHPLKRTLSFLEANRPFAGETVAPGIDLLQRLTSTSVSERGFKGLQEHLTLLSQLGALMLGNPSVTRSVESTLSSLYIQAGVAMQRAWEKAWTKVLGVAPDVEEVPYRFREPWVQRAIDDFRFSLVYLPAPFYPARPLPETFEPLPQDWELLISPAHDERVVKQRWRAEPVEPRGRWMLLETHQQYHSDAARYSAGADPLYRALHEADDGLADIWDRSYGLLDGAFDTHQRKATEFLGVPGKRNLGVLSVEEMNLLKNFLKVHEGILPNGHKVVFVPGYTHLCSNRLLQNGEHVTNAVVALWGTSEVIAPQLTPNPKEYAPLHSFAIEL